MSLDSEVEKAFIAHLSRYSKTYSTKAELARRFEIFAANFKMVNEHNARQTMYKMGFNQFSDMGEEEFPDHTGIDLSEAEILT